MNTLKLYLAESGRIADLHKDFPLYQGQFNDKLLNVYVPTSILAPQYNIQHYIGQTQGQDLPTDEELNAYVEYCTSPSREPQTGDVVEYIKVQDVDDQEYWLYIYDGSSWEGTEVDSFGALNNIAGTSIKIGMLATKRNGLIYKSKNYYMRYLKTLTYQNVEYALYERKLPKEFTTFQGQGENAPKLVVNVVEVSTSNAQVTNIVTSQTCSLDVMPSSMLDQDEPIESSELENLNAIVNELSAEMPNKQDKESEMLNTISHNIVGAINEVNSKTETNAGNIGSIQDEQIIQNAKIANLEDIVGSGEDYIGTYTNTYDPELNFSLVSSLITDYVLTKRPSVQGGDVVIYIQQIAQGTDKNYKFIYSGTQDAWTYYEIPPVEKADNYTYGIVKGTYESGNANSTQVNIENGEIKNIYVVDNYSQKKDLATYINEQQTEIAKIEDGTITVGKAESANKDGLGRNIATTYMTQNSGVTTQEMMDYALPRVFNDVSYVDKDNVYSDTIPSDIGALYTATASSIGDTSLFYVEKTIVDTEFQLGNKNSYSASIYLLPSIIGSADVPVTFRCITSIYHDNAWNVANVEITDTITLSTGLMRKVEFGSTLNSLAEVVDVVSGDIIKQEFEVTTTTSDTISFNIYSNETYPSTFYLNTSAYTIYLSQGQLGEIPVYTVGGEISNNVFICNFSQSVPIDDGITAVFKINYTPNAVIPSGTEFVLRHNNSDIRLVTPYNFNNSNNATLEDLQQVYVGLDSDLTRFVFEGRFATMGGDKVFIINMDNLTPVYDLVGDINTLLINLNSGSGV